MSTTSMWNQSWWRILHQNHCLIRLVRGEKEKEKDLQGGWGGGGGGGGI